MLTVVIPTRCTPCPGKKMAVFGCLRGVVDCHRPTVRMYVAARSVEGRARSDGTPLSSRGGLVSAMLVAEVHLLSKDLGNKLARGCLSGLRPTKGRVLCPCYSHAATGTFIWFY